MSLATVPAPTVKEADKSAHPIPGKGPANITVSKQAKSAPTKGSTVKTSPTSKGKTATASKTSKASSAAAVPKGDKTTVTAQKKMASGAASAAEGKSSRLKSKKAGTAGKSKLSPALKNGEANKKTPPNQTAAKTSASDKKSVKAKSETAKSPDKTTHPTADFPKLPKGRVYVPIKHKDGNVEYIIEVLRDPKLEARRAAELESKIAKASKKLAKVQERLRYPSNDHFSQGLQNELGHLLNKVYYSGKLEVKVKKELPRNPLDIKAEMKHSLDGHLVKTKRIRSVMSSGSSKGAKGQHKVVDHLVLERTKQPGGQLGAMTRQYKHKVFSSKQAEAERLAKKKAEVTGAATRNGTNKKGHSKKQTKKGVKISTKKTAANKTAANKTAANKTPANKTPANKTPANKTPANKTAANMTAAKKTAAKKTAAKKTAAKKTAAKKTAAKKASPSTETVKKLAAVSAVPKHLLSTT